MSPFVGKLLSSTLVVLFVNPLTPRVKPWVIQSFLIFDSFLIVFFFDFKQFVILEKLSILDLALSGVKGSNKCDVITGSQLQLIQLLLLYSAHVICS